MLNLLSQWADGKAKIFIHENIHVEVSPILGDDKKARFIELSNNIVIARATVWETGEMEFEAIDVQSERNILHKSLNVEEWEVDDKLNWWLSEIVIYEN